MGNSDILSDEFGKVWNLQRQKLNTLISPK